MEREHLDCSEFYGRAEQLADLALQLALRSGVELVKPEDYKDTIKRLIWKEMDEVYKSGC